MRLAVLFCLTSGLALAETWSGALVDARCYAAKERNSNPGNEDYNVNRDRDQEIRYCSPGSGTKAFAVVEEDGRSLTLDANGNSKAAELVRTSAKSSPLVVAVGGEWIDHTVKVESISLAARGETR